LPGLTPADISQFPKLAEFPQVIATSAVPAGYSGNNGAKRLPTGHNSGKLIALCNPLLFVVNEKGSLKMFLYSKVPVITAAVLLLYSGADLSAQQACVQYRFMPQTVYELQKVPVWKDVAETSYRNERVTSYKPVWTTERRENRYTVLKPVDETSYREQRQTVLKPVRKTSYRDETVNETTYETVTEMREEQVYEDVPVQETSYREEQVIVRKPVTETRWQSENVTVYRPMTVNETQYVPGVSAVQGWGVAQAPASTSLEWQRRGYTYNPLTGQFVWQRPGFHWVANPGAQVLIPQASLVPTLTPQTVQRTSLVPETIVQQKPVTVTSYVDEVTTRKVPVETLTTQRRVTTRKVPVQVQRPVTRQITRKVPVEETEYVSQEVVERIPVVTRRFDRVEKVEPYDVSVCRWEAVEVEQQTPVVTTRRVQTEASRWVARTVMVYVPVDMFGNPLPGYTSVRYIQPLPETTVTAMPTISETRLPVVSEPAVESTIVSRPAVEFPETRIRSESNLVPVEKKDSDEQERKDEDAGERTIEGNLQPADGDDSNNKGDKAADERPSLDNPTNGGETGDETSLRLDQLEGPARPDVDERAEKPRRPSGT
jgi:YTV